MVSEEVKRKMENIVKLKAMVAVHIKSGTPDAKIVESMARQFPNVWTEQQLSGILADERKNAGVQLLRRNETKGMHHKDTELYALREYFDEIILRPGEEKKKVLNLHDAMKRVNLVRGSAGSVSREWVMRQLTKLKESTKVDCVISAPRVARAPTFSFTEARKRLGKDPANQGKSFRVDQGHFIRNPKH